MKHLVGLLVFALLMSACSPGTTFPLLIPTPLPPDEDCSNYAERAVDLSQMDELFMSGTDTEILFDEDGAREHGFSEKVSPWPGNGCIVGGMAEYEAGGRPSRGYGSRSMVLRLCH